MVATEDRRPENQMEKVLQRLRERYIEEEGEEPPEDFMQEARLEILRSAAKKNRDNHREIYDALADE